MARVFVNDSTLTDIADAIREKNGTEDTYKPSQMADAVRGIQSGGGVDWFHYMVSLNRAFYEVDLGTPTDLDIFLGKNVDATILGTWGDSFCFHTKNLRNVKLKCNNPTEQSVQFSTVFYGSTVETIDLTEFILAYKAFSQPFRDCKQLVSIWGKMDLSQCTSTMNAFMNCKSLVDVDFAENSIKTNISFLQSPNLSDASIQSIIDGLADLTGQTAQTLTFHADIKAKLTESQISQITAKNWTLA